MPYPAGVLRCNAVPGYRASARLSARTGTVPLADVQDADVADPAELLHMGAESHGADTKAVRVRVEVNEKYVPATLPRRDCSTAGLRAWDSPRAVIQSIVGCSTSRTETR